MKRTPRLILVGGGHAHLEVLRRLQHDRRRPEVLLISAYPRHHYSGMVPGFLAGIYGEDQIAFDLSQLAAGAKVKFVCDRVTRCDPRARQIGTRSSGEFAYDWVSFNIGSRAAGSDDPRIRKHAQLVKPISRAVQLRQRVEDFFRATSRSGQLSISIVGAGAGGFEVALALDRLARRHNARVAVTLWESGQRILAGYPEGLRLKAERILAKRQLAVRTRATVEAIESDALLMSGGDRHPSDLTVWLTGAEAPALFRETGLPVDERGFLLVDPHLRSVGDTRVFGAGDCVTPDRHRDTPKAGVFAVREAPVLWQNLKAAVSGLPLSATYQPQSGFLSILNTCDGKALLDYHGWVSYSRWAWWLKDWIDRKFVQRYQ